MRTRRGLRAATAPMAAAVALLCTLTSSTVAETAGDPPPVPLLDQHDSNGAWAGWSLGHRFPTQPAAPPGSVAGMDVSGHQGPVDWAKAFDDGARFSYVKATEGNTPRNDQFSQQYGGAAKAGMIRGAYHYALPDHSSGAQQARVFVDHGGGWSADGRTLPGALDIEHNPYGDQCYGLTPEEMSAWIADFSDTYRSLTGRPPSIYTTTTWWDRCTGNNRGFTDNPLWIARYSSEIGPLPGGWRVHTIWQFATSGTFPGDQNTFNGDSQRLIEFAG